MAELLPILLPLLLIDIFNPVFFATLVFAAGSDRPVSNSSSMLLGYAIANFAAGILVAIGFERLAARYANPLPIDFVLGGAIGIGLLWVAMPVKRRGPAAAKKPQWELTPSRCFGFGAIMNFVGTPFGLPYLAAVDQLLKADLGVGESLVVLTIYNIAYALPFAVVPLMVARFGVSARPILERINGSLTKAAAVTMPWLLGLLGLVLVVDSASYFLRGTGLW